MEGKKVREGGGSGGEIEGGWNGEAEKEVVDE